MSATSDFLVNVFKISRMNEWRTAHPEQWDQFSEWAKTGVGDDSKLNDAQRKWLKQLRRTGAGTDNDPLERWHNSPKGFVIVKNFPPVTDLKESEWKELYLACQSTFTRLRANKTSYDGAVQDFITNNESLFDKVTDDTLVATPQTDAAILALIRQLDGIDDYELVTVLGITKSEISKLVATRAGGIITGIKKDYNNNPEIRDKIKGWAQKVLNPDATHEEKIVTDFGFDRAFIAANHLTHITSEHTWRPPEVDPAKLNAFKAGYSDFFADMVREDSDSTKIYEAFKACEPENKVVSESIEKAKKDIDYNDPNSKNFVPKKMDTKLTVVEQIQKWAGDTYSDYFKKYEEFRGARIYQHASEVKDILKQIDKAKIKTTDTLSKLVENADGITKKLQGTNKQAADAFEWLATSLKEFDANPAMSSVMKKALESGRKMNDLVSELIMRAAEDGKPETVKKAEIAMEILATMKYGNTTSKVMDAIKEDKTLFDIFSNEKLSWNKNAGMKFVTAAVDKTIRAACLGFGRGAAFLVNRFRRHGIRFNGRFRSSKMRQAHDDYVAKHAADLATAQAARTADTASAPILPGPDTRSEYKKSLDENRAKRAAALTNLSAGLGFVPADADLFVEQQQRELNTVGEDNIVAKEEALRQYDYLFRQLEKALELRQELDQRNLVPGPSYEKTQLQKSLNDLGIINLPLTPPRPINLGTASEVDIQTAINDIQADASYLNARTEYVTAINEKAEKQQHIDDYRRATQEIKIAEERIEARQKKLDALNKNDIDGNPYDIYKHLMAYWDTLQNPTLTRFGLRRASKIQAQNSSLVGDLFQQRLGTYNLR